MKQNWNLELINKYIKNKVEENLHLDYKASGSLEKNDKKANEIAKDVSAFANSDGGTIIYGIKENSINKHLPDETDPIDRNNISKEWIEQIIQGRITPRIQNLSIIPITIKEPNEVVYVIEIPKSDTVHQANDRKYYKRFNFNSEPMYDYEIKDILNRTKYPKIDLEFSIIVENYKTSKQKFSDLGIPYLKTEIEKHYSLNIYARNNGKIYANYINAYFSLNDKYLLSTKNSEEDNLVQYSCDNTVRDIVDVTMTGLHAQKKYGPSRYKPILPRLRFKLQTLKLNEHFLNSNFEIKWVVYSDNSEPNTGKIELCKIEVIEK